MSPTLLLASARFAAGIARMSLGPLLPVVSADLGLSPDAKPTLLSAYSLGYILTQILGGSLADRYGARSVVAIGVGVSSFIVLLLTVSDSERWFSLYFALGVLAGPLFPASSVVLRSSVRPKDRAGAAAIIDAAASAGACVATLAPAAAVLMGWRGVMVCTAVLLLVVSLAGIAYLKQPKTRTRAQRQSNFSLEKKQWVGNEERAHGVLYSLPALALYLCNSCDNFCKYGLNAWLATMFVEKFQVTPSVVGSWLAAQEIVGVASRVVIGLRDPGQKFRWIASASAFLLQAAFLFLAFHTPSASPGYCALFLTCFAFVSAGHTVGFRPRYVEMAPEHTGEMSGYGNTIASLASVMGPVVIGSLVNQNLVAYAADDAADGEKWERVGHLMAAVCILGALTAMAL